MTPKPLALTMGDPAGIGPEIAIKAWRALRAGGPPFVLFADPGVMTEAAARLSAPAPAPVSEPARALDVFGEGPPVIALPGPADDPARQTIASIEAAVAAAAGGACSAVVTNPISKASLYRAGFGFPGHTEFVDHLTAHLDAPGARGPVMMLAAPELKAALVTIHMSLKDSIAALSVERIAHVGRVVAEAMRRDFGVERPRLALAGLNPHAGEAGALGTEEIEIVIPAAEKLRAEGFEVAGPMPPDTMFHAEARAGYDAAVCLYHDQGLIPVKTLNFHGAVNVTLGLPVIRCSPDHGTAFDIAGLGLARPDSLIAALRLAAEMAERRGRPERAA